MICFWGEMGVADREDKTELSGESSAFVSARGTGVAIRGGRRLGRSCVYCIFSSPNRGSPCRDKASFSSSSGTDWEATACSDDSTIPLVAYHQFPSRSICRDHGLELIDSDFIVAGHVYGAEVDERRSASITSCC